MNIAPLRDLKHNTWYYGIRCACQRLLAVCEDALGGNSDETVFRVPIKVSVECECGKVTEVPVLRKFKTS